MPADGSPGGWKVLLNVPDHAPLYKKLDHLPRVAISPCYRMPHPHPTIMPVFVFAHPLLPVLYGVGGFHHVGS